MAERNPLTDVEVSRLRELHASGASRNAIAKELGRSSSTVSAAAAKLGLSFDRTATATATAAAAAAKVADAKSRRAALVLDLLDDAERLRQQLWEPTTLHSFGGKDHTYASKRLTEPTFADKRSIMRAVSTAVTASTRLELHDAADEGTAGAKSMLLELASALNVANDALNAEDEAEPPPDE